MIENQELWFSDMRFLNDSREFKHVSDMIEASVRRYADAHRQNWVDHGCSGDAFDQMVRNFRANCHDKALYERVSKLGLPFIFSLSEGKDVLSQWRAYGNGEYCIGFDTAKLLELQNLQILKVEYSDEGKGAPELSDMLEWFFKYHLEHIHPDGTVDSEVSHDGLDDVLSRSSGSDLFFKHKNSAFQEEQEWRMVVRRGIEDKCIFFDANGRHPVPRFKVRSPTNENMLSKAITEIICGPGVEYERGSIAIELMKRKTKCHNIQISRSIVPYRTN